MAIRRPRITTVVGSLLLGFVAVVAGRSGSKPEEVAAITITAVADRAAVKPGETTQVTVRVRVEAASRADDLETPLHLSVLMDTSGSMVGDPIEQAKLALHTVVDELRPMDSLDIVTFDSQAKLLLVPTQLDDLDRDEVHAQIDAIVAEGTTDLSAGLAASFAAVGNRAVPGHLNRMVIIGDGIPNDASAIPGQVDAIRRAGYSITALGVGLDYDEVLFGEIARTTGGHFHHIDGGDGLVEGLAKELMGAQRQVAGNVQLSLTSGPGVTIRRVVGLSGEMSGQHRYAVMTSDLAEGQLQDVFVELDVVASKTASSVELLDTVVSYEDRIGGAGRVERRAFVSMPVSEQKEALAMLDDEVTGGVIAARAAAATIDAIAMAQGGLFAEADALLLENDVQLSRAMDRAKTPDDAPVAAQRDGIRLLRQSMPKLIDPAAPRGVVAEESYRGAAKDANANASEFFQSK